MDDATLDQIAGLATRIKECQAKLNGYTKTRDEYVAMVNNAQAELDALYASMREKLNGMES